MGHTEDEVEEKYSQNKTETITDKTVVTTSIELLSQFHTTRDLVRVLKTLAESLASKYTLRVENIERRIGGSNGQRPHNKKEWCNLQV